MDQSSPPLPTETPIWGHPTLSVEHPWTRVRSGKPGPGKSPPGSPNEPSNEVRHLKYLAATTNNTVQKPPDNGNPQSGQAVSDWEIRHSLLSCPRERLPHAIPTAFPPSCWNMTTGTRTRQPSGDASPDGPPLAWRSGPRAANLASSNYAKSRFMGCLARGWASHSPLWGTPPSPVGNSWILQRAPQASLTPSTVNRINRLELFFELHTVRIRTLQRLATR